MAKSTGTKPIRGPKERLPKALKPMLAKPGTLPEGDDGRWGFEIKWDGVRALGFAEHGSWRMCSRRGEEITHRYPELAPLAEQIADHDAILDGEVVALDDEGRPRFQLLQARMGLTSAAAIDQRAAARPVDYIVFDLLHLDGRSTRELPYTTRRELLESLALDGPRWRTPRRRSERGPRRCWRRRGARASRESSRSAARAPTAPEREPASGSSSASGSARSS